MLQAPDPASAQTPAAVWSAPREPVAFRRGQPTGGLCRPRWHAAGLLVGPLRRPDHRHTPGAKPGPSRSQRRSTSPRWWLTRLSTAPWSAMPTLVSGCRRPRARLLARPAGRRYRPATATAQPPVAGRPPHWSAPDVVAAGNAMTATVALDAAALPDGGLALAYIREAHTSGAAPGLYVRRLSDQGPWARAWARPSWSTLRSICACCDPDTIRLRLAAAPDGALYLDLDGCRPGASALCAFRRWRALPGRRHKPTGASQSRIGSTHDPVAAPARGAPAHRWRAAGVRGLAPPAAVPSTSKRGATWRRRCRPPPPP